MAIKKQLSVFLENKPGILARMCESFKENDINFIAISVSDTVDHAVVRMLVSDTQKAIHILEERGVLVVETDVLALKVDDKPGALLKIAKKLSKAKVNLEYAYGTAGADKKSSLLVLRVDNIKKAQKLLK